MIEMRIIILITTKKDEEYSFDENENFPLNFCNLCNK